MLAYTEESADSGRSKTGMLKKGRRKDQQDYPDGTINGVGPEAHRLLRRIYPISLMFHVCLPAACFKFAGHHGSLCSSFHLMLPHLNVFFLVEAGKWFGRKHLFGVRWSSLFG